MSESNNTSQKPVFECLSKGPYRIKNLEYLTNIDGKELPSKAVMALCRCGKSENKPFCDGAHVAAGFDDQNESDGEWNKRDSYIGKKITIHDNRGVCSHAGFCTDNLTSVFLMGTEPWINPDGAEVEKIIETIEKCPSGALSYSINDKEHQSFHQKAAVKVVRNGPYYVQGGIELSNITKGKEVSDEHYTLCRCGGSKNKPFCDGTHGHIDYRDDSLVRIATPDSLEEGITPVTVEGVELVIVKKGELISVLNATCLHQGASLSGGTLDGDYIACPLHDWRYNINNGELEGDPGTCLKTYEVTLEKWDVLISKEELLQSKQPEKEESLPLNEEDEPTIRHIHELAKHGLRESHGAMGAMGVLRKNLPSWDDLQILTAQLHRFPLLDADPVGTELIIGPKAKKPLKLDIPIFVSDMSFGSLSFEAKIALASGAERAGTGICSGEGGMLSEEQQANRRYFYELASAQFGFSMEKMKQVQAFHFKGGQGAKTGVGGHLPGKKVTRQIASVRGLKPGNDAISPSRFNFKSLDDFKQMASEIRETTGGIPIGFKLSAQHIEKDIEAALNIGVDYIILDGRGGGTGAAPLIIRDHISVPTLAALPRARKFLDESGHPEVTLIVTGGLRTAPDFVKALALGADGVAISNAALQAIGCIGARACNTNQCPAGIATQDEELRKKFDLNKASSQLLLYLLATTDLMKILARACGYSHLNQFQKEDLTTWKRKIADLTGVHYAGYS